jgi:hypothetical protein
VIINRLVRGLAFAGLLCVFGCGSPAPTTGDPGKKITWAEYSKMDAEQKDDPYVLDNLDDEAKKRLAAATKKTKR